MDKSSAEESSHGVDPFSHTTKGTVLREILPRIKIKRVNEKPQRRLWIAAELTSGAAPCSFLFVFPKAVNQLPE